MKKILIVMISLVVGSVRAAALTDAPGKADFMYPPTALTIGREPCPTLIRGEPTVGSRRGDFYNIPL